jgi:aspartyl-tRNA(Asn)/glutamyl-tRNA(Gln) amidotransferase subunit A
MTKNLNELSITEAARALRARECSVRELFDACMLAAKAQNPELNAYLEFFDDAETTAAIEAAQKRIDADGAKDPANGDASLLCGIPLAIKDNILINGRIASASSKMLENYRATYDATVIKKLKEQGALFVGRTNMDEFALGGSTENSAFGPTKNPHDASRVAGGTSGGSAAAVSANFAIAALGTDTGGSVRNPASYCGVVGFKPTYGGVSRSGLIAAASSFDQCGPITKTVADAKILFEAIRGNDPLDSTTIPENFSYPKTEIKNKLRIGVPRDLVGKVQDAAVSEQFEKTLADLKAAGHEIVDIELPTSPYAIAAYYIINFAEVSTNLSRFDGVRYGHAVRGKTLLDDYVDSRTEGFGDESKRRILLGTFVLSAGYIDAYYRKALAARSQLAAEYEKAFESVDVIATPTMPTPAFVIGEKSDPVAMYLEDVFTVTANLTGMPAISVPMGMVACEQGNKEDKSKKELPVGIHFTAPKGAEDLLFTIGAAVTKETL